MQKPIFNNQELFFKTTSIPKIVILSILTFGLYEVVWFYNIWKNLASNLDYKISPFWRAFFCSITNFFLFPIISKYIEKYTNNGFPPIIFATLYLLLNATQRLNEPYWLISFCTIFIIVDIQNKINDINSKYYPETAPNAWSTANTVWSILGCILWSLSFILLILPE